MLVRRGCEICKSKSCSNPEHCSVGKYDSQQQQPEVLVKVQLSQSDVNTMLISQHSCHILYTQRYISLLKIFFNFKFKSLKIFHYSCHTLYQFQVYTPVPQEVLFEAPIHFLQSHITNSGVYFCLYFCLLLQVS